MSIHKSVHQRDFLILDNAILRSPKLSWKAKGLLAFCLSLPEDWTFSIQGLAHFSADGVDSIRSAVQELEAAGYILRRRKRTGGRFSGMEYEIMESPVAENPVQENPPLPSIQLPSTQLPSMKKHSIYADGIPAGWDGLADSIRESVEYDTL